MTLSVDNFRIGWWVIELPCPTCICSKVVPRYVHLWLIVYYYWLWFASTFCRNQVKRSLHKFQPLFLHSAEVTVHTSQLGAEADGSSLLATLALSNVDKSNQHIIEQDTTLLMTLHLSKLWESLEAWLCKVNMVVLASNWSHNNLGPSFTWSHFWIICCCHAKDLTKNTIVGFHISKLIVYVSCYLLVLLQTSPSWLWYSCSRFLRFSLFSSYLPVSIIFSPPFSPLKYLLYPWNISPN